MYTKVVYEAGDPHVTDLRDVATVKSAALSAGDQSGRKPTCLHLLLSPALCVSAVRRPPVQTPRSPGAGLAAPSTVMVWTPPDLLFLHDLDWSPSPGLLLRSGAVVILTSATRSGGEVRITEAERPGHVSPGRRGYRTGITAHSISRAGAAL
jgi:hypothetical protein